MTKCKTTVVSRVTGYFSNFHQWNPGKQQEFKERKKFDKDIKEISKIQKFKDNPLAYG